MGRTIFEALGGSSALQGQNQNMAQALLQHMQTCQENPVQAVQSKLSSGEWTQEQYNQLHSMAENIARNMMGVLRR